MLVAPIQADRAFCWQALEQNLTLSQFSRHFFRQTIGRPQAAQSLLGSVDLLPRKVIAKKGDAAHANIHMGLHSI